MADYKALYNELSLDLNDINTKFVQISDLLQITGAKLVMDQYDNITIEFIANKLRVKDLGITTSKIADAAVTQAKISPDVVITPGPNSITTAMIQDGAVTEPKLADGAVTNPKLAPNSVGTSNLQDLSVTNNKIQGPIDTSKINFTDIDIAYPYALIWDANTGLNKYQMRYRVLTPSNALTLEDVSGTNKLAFLDNGQIGIGGTPNLSNYPTYNEVLGGNVAVTGEFGTNFITSLNAANPLTIKAFDGYGSLNFLHISGDTSVANANAATNMYLTRGNNVQGRINIGIDDGGTYFTGTSAGDAILSTGDAIYGLHLGQVGTPHISLVNDQVTVNKDTIPGTTETYSLGSSLWKYLNGYIKNLFATSIKTDSVTARTVDGNLTIGGNGTGSVNSTADINPDTTNTRSLGSSVLTWLSGFFTTLTSTTVNTNVLQPTSASDINVGGNLYPTLDVTYNLGRSAFRWLNVNCQGLAASFISGCQSLSSGTTFTIITGTGPQGTIIRPTSVGNVSMVISRSGTGDGEICVADSTGAFSSSAVQGDMVIRNNNAGKAIHFNIGGSAASASVVSDGLQFPNSTPFYLATSLNYNEEFSFTATITGAFSAIRTINFTRRGTRVTLCIPDILAPATSATSLTFNLPERLRPNALTYGSPGSIAIPCRVKNNGTFQLSIADIFPATGNVSFYATPGGVGFTVGSSASGVTACPLTYDI